MDTPLVSVITPTYNRAAYIAAAIESVLAQTYINWELLIIDDGSTDNTTSIVMNYIEKEKIGRNNSSRISYIKNTENKGIAYTRNIGLEKARGTYIAVLDSDDIWIDRTKLAQQITFLQEKNSSAQKTQPSEQLYAVLGTWAKKIDSRGENIGEIKNCTDDATIRKIILRRSPFIHSSTVFLRQAMIDAGGYSQTYGIGDDYELMLKIGMNYRFANLPQFTTGYRIHPENITATKRAQHVREHLAIIKKYRTEYPGFLLALIKGYLRLYF